MASDSVFNPDGTRDAGIKRSTHAIDLRPLAPLSVSIHHQHSFHHSFQSFRLHFFQPPCSKTKDTNKNFDSSIFRAHLALLVSIAWPPSSRVRPCDAKRSSNGALLTSLHLPLFPPFRLARAWVELVSLRLPLLAQALVNLPLSSAFALFVNPFEMTSTLLQTLHLLLLALVHACLLLPLLRC